jgi:hypothetical protein
MASIAAKSKGKIVRETFIGKEFLKGQLNSLAS